MIRLVPEGTSNELPPRNTFLRQHQTDSVVPVGPRTLARVGLSLGTALGAALCASPVRAQAIVPTLHVDCGELGELGRAALEARARADLASTPRSTGAVVLVTCTESSAVVAWGPAEGGPRARRLALGDDEATNTDAILDAIHGLSMETELPAAVPETPAPLAAGAGPAPAAIPFTPAARPAPPARASSPHPPSHRLGLLSGLRAELWQGDVGGALDGHVGARVPVSGDWSLFATAGFGPGVTSPQGIQAETLRAVVGVDRKLLTNVSVGIGATARVLFLQASRSAPPQSETVATVGLVASARYEIRLGAEALSVGPELDVLAQPLAVDVAGAEVFRIPLFVAGLSVDFVTGIHQ